MFARRQRHFAKEFINVSTGSKNINECLACGRVAHNWDGHVYSGQGSVFRQSAT